MRPILGRLIFLRQVAMRLVLGVLRGVILKGHQILWGIIPAILTMLSLYHAAFITSRFLNQLTNSKIRATVLSVKGLIFNLAYATFSTLFAQTLLWQESHLDQNQAFQSLLTWTPIFLIISLLLFLTPLSLRTKNHS